MKKDDYLDEDNEGKSPADIPRKILEDIGGPQSYQKAIRAKCIDCCGEVIREVSKCPAYKCPLWPFRMGKNPFSNRKGNPKLFKAGRGVT